MSSKDDMERDEQEREVRVVIQDKRHSRDLEAQEEEAEAPAPAPAVDLRDNLDAEATRPFGELDSKVLDFPQAAALPVLPADDHSRFDDFSPDDAELEAPPPGSAEDAAAQAQAAQLRQVFGLGLSRYLQGQLELLLTFALIGLGRAPDPATGLVAQNLPQARLAIDVLEFLVQRLEPDLHPQDKLQLQQLITDLKYTYMQVVGSAPVVAPPIGES
jgi:hypothetical protein